VKTVPSVGSSQVRVISRVIHSIIIKDRCAEIYPYTAKELDHFWLKLNIDSNKWVMGVGFANNTSEYIS
jgi:hypothetical protein